MKKFGYVIAAFGAIAIAVPSIASAAIVIKEGGHRHLHARAEMHRGHDWHPHRDRMMIIKHRRRD